MLVRRSWRKYLRIEIRRYEPELDTTPQSYIRPQVNSASPFGRSEDVKDRDKKGYEPESGTTPQSYARPQVNSVDPEGRVEVWESREEVDGHSNHGSDESTASSSDWEEVESLDPRYAPAPWV